MLDRCTLNKGAFAFKIVRGALKWPLKGGSRLIEVAATAGLTVASSDMTLSKKRITKARHGCAGWSAPALFAKPLKTGFLASKPI